jgi:hypothetical protein
VKRRDQPARQHVADRQRIARREQWHDDDGDGDEDERPRCRAARARERYSR